MLILGQESCFYKEYFLIARERGLFHFQSSFFEQFPVYALLQFSFDTVSQVLKDYLTPYKELTSFFSTFLHELQKVQKIGVANICYFLIFWTYLHQLCQRVLEQYASA